MAKLGVVTCQILELEFAYVLSNDPEISEIWVVNDQFSAELIEILENDGSKRIHRASHIEEFETAEKNDLTVLINVLELGLHSNIPVLTREVKAAVAKIAAHVDAVLLGYGLCGNALKDAAQLFRDISVPVMLPMQNKEPVDDCVGLIIGGRENYYEEQCRCAGTMFMNAGFSRHWNKILSLDIPEKLLPKKDKILDRMMSNYKRSLLLSTPVLG
ncbi:MAG: DUF1638 domain-containing protein, partial [Desulfobacterales bacterium]|nr:DUF1638 domain-containing protein [Desulfobacterales bacterium]